MNAKEELLTFLKEGLKIKCACVNIESSGPDKVLKVGHTGDEFSQFLESLNFDYDDGFGYQELYGTVWFEDGTWLSRGEYDGSEWWEHQVVPEINSKCL